MATGWDKQQWIDIVLFHARLAGNQIIIEGDNFQEGIITALIAAGVRSEDIVTNVKPEITRGN